MELEKTIKFPSYNIISTPHAQLKPLDTPKSLFIPLSVVLKNLQHSAISSDEIKSNNYDAALNALSEERFGDNAEKVAEQMKEVFITNNEFIPKHEKEERTAEVEEALQDAKYCEENVKSLLQIDHFQI